MVRFRFKAYKLCLCLFRGLWFSAKLVAVLGGKKFPNPNSLFRFVAMNKNSVIKLHQNLHSAYWMPMTMVLQPVIFNMFKVWAGVLIESRNQMSALLFVLLFVYTDMPTHCRWLIASQDWWAGKQARAKAFSQNLQKITGFFSVCRLVTFRTDDPVSIVRMGFAENTNR